MKLSKEYKGMYNQQQTQLFELFQKKGYRLQDLIAMLPNNILDSLIKDVEDMKGFKDGEDS